MKVEKFQNGGAKVSVGFLDVLAFTGLVATICSIVRGFFPDKEESRGQGKTA